MRRDEGFLRPWPLGPCKSLSDVLSFLNSRAYRAPAGAAGRSAAVAGTPPAAEQRLAGGHCALPGYRRDGRRRSVRCAAGATGWWGAPIIWCRRATRGRSFVVPVEVKSRSPSGPALRQPHPATGDLLSARRGKLRRCAPLRSAALRRRHAAHRRTQTNCAAACLIAAAEIRQARRAPEVRRSHSEPRRCAGCGYRSACGSEALA